MPPPDIPVATPVEVILGVISAGLAAWNAHEQHSGAVYAPKHAVPKVIYTPGEAKRGFITAILTPVNSRQEPKFGVRQSMWLVTLTFGGIALMRLLLAQ